MVLNYVVPMAATIVLATLFVVFFTKKYKHSNDAKKLVPIRISFFILLALEAAKIFYLIAKDSEFRPSRYPIVFCSLVFAAYPLFCFGQNRFSTVAKSFSAIPSLIIFVLFAATNTGLELSIIQAHSYLFHGLMAAIGIYLFTCGLYKIEFKNFFPLFSVLAGYIVFSTVLSLFIGGDISYFGPDSSIIAPVYKMFGYAVGNFMIIIVMFLLTIFGYGLSCIKKKKATKSAAKGGEINV